MQGYQDTQIFYAWILHIDSCGLGPAISTHLKLAQMDSNIIIYLADRKVQQYKHLHPHNFVETHELNALLIAECNESFQYISN